MPYDLALSQHGDLVMTASRDALGISGTDLIEQRIKIRLMLHRGEWVFDTEGTLGSQLYTLSGTPSEDALGYVDSYVREALRDMEEISIEEVQIYPSDHDVVLVVAYQPQLTEGEALIVSDPGLQEISFTIPTIAANE